MPHASLSHGTSTFASAAVALPHGPVAAAAGTAAATAASTAQQAVASVMKAADVQATAAESANPSVNLGFDFGDDHLAVRVEMKGGEVHAHFTSSSSELQQAVATQWSAMTSHGDSQGQRSYTFAQPQFSSGDAPNDSGGGANNSSAFEGEARKWTDTQAAAALSGSFGAVRSSATAVAPADTAVLIAPGSLHLNARA